MPAEHPAPRLLVVEDCPITHRLLTALLAAEGHRVTVAEDVAAVRPRRRVRRAFPYRR
jgi:CheY-like chemotaxis protein